jgi:hypothetical protein
MLRRDRSYEDGLPGKSLIDAFRIIEDEDLSQQLPPQDVVAAVSETSGPSGALKPLTVRVRMAKLRPPPLGVCVSS